MINAEFALITFLWFFACYILIYISVDISWWFRLTDASQRSSSSCQSVKRCAQFRQFQEKADEAGLIVFVLSNDFAKSRFTRKQVLIAV